VQRFRGAPKSLMPTWSWRALALAAIAGSLVLISSDFAQVGHAGTFGLVVSPDTAQMWRVSRVDPGLPAERVGIRAGDRVAPATGDFADKVNLQFPPGPNASLALVVERNGMTRRVELRSVYRHHAQYEELAAQTVDIALELMKIIFFLVAALIVVRRADRSPARALATFLIALAFGVVDISSSYPPAAIVALATVSTMAVVFALTQAIRFATIFPHSSPTGPRAAIARANVWANIAIVIAGAAYVSPFVLPAVSARLFLAMQAFIIMFAVYVVAALTVAFTIGWREADSVDRERIRWIAVSTAIGLGGLILTLALGTLGVNQWVAVPFVFGLAAIPIGTAYAILRHRMLDIGFVLNRALVFAIISALVVAAFTLLEFVLGRYLTSLGHVQSAVLEALLALGIGVSLGRIHARVDTVVDTIFFRDRHRSEAALHRLAREAAYVDDPHVLAERIVTAVDRHGNANGTALYLQDGTCYLPYLATLSRTEPVERNDAAIVRLRALGDEVDLEDLAREVGPTSCPGTIAFPMVVRGELLGVLACGSKRDFQAYAPDERATLSELAHAAGIAFDTIHTLALRRAVDRAIAGDVDLDDLRRARLSFDGGLPS